jgi:hypothetical protein
LGHGGSGGVTGALAVPASVVAAVVVAAAAGGGGVVGAVGVVPAQLVATAKRKVVRSAP